MNAASLSKAQSPTMRCRESPLLEPLVGRHPKPRRRPKLPDVRHLPVETRRKWLREALETLDATALSLAMRNQLADSQRGADTVSIEMNPEITTADERALALLSTQVGDENAAQSSHLSSKRAPYRHATSPHCRQATGTRKVPARLTVAPLVVSREMIEKLQTHILDKIRGDIWQNEIRSRLARPLSATVFCSRHEQLQHPLVAPQFAGPSLQAPGGPYPYSEEAHQLTRRFDRMYRKHVLRRELLFNVRRLAVAIRFFRRVIVPWLVKAFRRRRRAAMAIQRRVRRHFLWKRRVLRPFVERFVQHVTQTARCRAAARQIVAERLRRLVRRRKEREAYARERRRVLYRWVAKTRVALFVHTVWIVRWLREQRAHNLAQMQQELQQLETSDAAVLNEYVTIFDTSFGKRLLKKELNAWREGVKRIDKTEENGDDVAVEDVQLRLRQCFRIFDLDGSGTLDLDEFELLLSYLRTSLAETKAKRRAKLTTAQVRDLFETLDVDGNGKVTRDEFVDWWKTQSGSGHGSASASISLLSTGLDHLVLTGHGLLFWLLGKKQQLERKFTKKMLIKRAQDSAKRAILEALCMEDSQEPEGKYRTWRCVHCARRFGLQRDLKDHLQHESHGTLAPAVVVDAFVWRKWIHQEELRLLEETNPDTRTQAASSCDDGT